MVDMEVVWEILNYQCMHESLHTMANVDTTSCENALAMNVGPRDAGRCTLQHCAVGDIYPAVSALLRAATAHHKMENIGAIPVHSEISENVKPSMLFQSVEEVVTAHEPVNIELNHTLEVLQLDLCGFVASHRDCFYVYAEGSYLRMTGEVKTLQRTMSSAI